MSKKRTSAESNNGNFHPDDHAKCAKPEALSDTTLQDLPFELLECILVKVVAIEVRGWWLAKSEWKEKTDLAISRLRTVCSQWSYILTTISFRTKLHRILDGTVQGTIHFEITNESPIHSAILATATMKDEIFILQKQEGKDGVIYCHDRNNMAEVKGVIHLPRTNPVWMAACNVSNCVYVGLRNNLYPVLKVLRISKDEEQQFKIRPWIEDHRRFIYSISVSANGSLIILSVEDGLGPNVVSIYDANGSLQHEIMLSPDIDAFSNKNIIQKSNGNLVVAFVNYQDHKLNLLEIDTAGSVLRKYQSSFGGDSFVNVADIYGRIMITDPLAEMELLDSELNLLGTYSLQQDKGKNLLVSDLHYDSERNEIVRIHFDWKTGPAVTIFRLTEE